MLCALLNARSERIEMSVRRIIMATRVESRGGEEVVELFAVVVNQFRGFWRAFRD
jgi:hypothetical protein